MLEKDYNFASYQAEIEDYLVGKKYGNLSVKSTLADIEHFWNWSVAKSQKGAAKLSSHNTLSAVITSGALQQYVEELSSLESNTGIKRRMAALERLLEVAVEKEWLKRSLFQAFQKLAISYGELLKQTSELSQSFAEYLVKEGANKNTIRGYVADINEYLDITSSTQNR